VTLTLVTLALVVVIAIYYLLDMHAMPRIIRRLLPAAQRERIWSILLEADRNVGGFLRGQLIACIIVGVLTSIFLIFVGLRQYAILIGCFAGLMHFIPYLGPVAGGTPALLWVLLSQNFQSWPQRGVYVLIIVAGFGIIETIDGFITQPYIVGRSASLHPLTVMLALAIGAQAGIGGMIIAVPSACLARVLWLELFWNKRPDPGQGPSCPVDLEESGAPEEGPSCQIDQAPLRGAVPTGPDEIPPRKD
jgi:predicted PurR-regulated permease PerM